MYRRCLRSYSLPSIAVKFHGTTCIVMGMARRYELKRRASVRTNAPADRRRDDRAPRGRRRGGDDDQRDREARRRGQGHGVPALPGRGGAVRRLQRALLSHHPFPDLERWRQIPGPGRPAAGGTPRDVRLARREPADDRMALAEARDLPLMAPYHGYWASAGDVLAAPWDVQGRRRSILRATIALALSFDTHRTLTQEQRLREGRAIEPIRLAESA